MLSFSGKDYHGMQRNPGDQIKTIEGELLRALGEAGQVKRIVFLLKWRDDM